LFNGIIKNNATFVDFKNNILVLKFNNLPKQIDLGDSIAVNGVCLTVTNIKQNNVSFDVLEETCKRTNLCSSSHGKLFNIEFPISLNDMISGHVVSGHVDFVSELISIDKEQYTFSLPDEYKHLVVSKGSITLNGVALTSCDATNNTFSVYLIPETLNQTNLSNLKIGSHVNVEIDMLARYVDRILTYK
jgi:riboflavin synthase